MIFDVLSIDTNNVEHTWYYDNVANVFYGDNGSPITFSNAPHKKKISIYPFYGDDNPYTFERVGRKLKGIHIVLGTKCNFHCKYCIQENTKDRIVEFTPENVTDFMNVLSQYDLEKTITLYGGEPLVYWKVLLILIPQLRQRYPNVKLSMITNGSLLDIEKIDFLYKYRCNINISWEGTNTYRDYNIFEDPKVLEAVQYGYNTNPDLIGIFTIYSDVSTSLIKNKKYLASLGIGDINIRKFGIVKCNNDFEPHVDYVHIEDDKLDAIEEEMYQHGMLRDDITITNKIDRAIKGFAMNKNITEHPVCGFSKFDWLALDAKGNAYVCENRHISVGNISKIDDIRIKNFYHITHKKKCVACYLCNICNGVGCQALQYDNSSGFEESCRNVAAISRGTFRAAFETLFKMKLIKVIPHEV